MNRFKQATFGALLALVAHFAAAQDKTPAQVFRQTASGASFSCGLKSSTFKMAENYGSPEAGAYGQELSHCITTARSDLAEAYKALDATDAPTSVKAAAKAVYAAWLPYGNELGRGMTSREQDRSRLAEAYKAAMAAYRTELDLAP